MRKGYFLRIESAIAEPAENPIRSILVDRKSGRYNLLNEEQTHLVREAIEKRIFGEISTSQPFRVQINLEDLFRNVDLIDISSDRQDILSAPLSAYTEIANRCNLGCIGCYQGERKYTEKMETWQIKEFFHSFASIGGIIIRLTGKEPTTNKDIVEIIEHGKMLGLKIALNTNGVASSRLIGQIIEAGLDEVVISLDGRRETHNHFRNADIFEKTLASAKMFAEAGVDTRFNMTVSPANMGDIEFVARLANEMGIYVSYIPIRNIGSAIEGASLTAGDMEMISRKISSLRKEVKVRLLTYFDIYGETSDYYHPMFQLTPCHARKNIFVTNNGNVYPCDHLVSLGDTFCGGNVTKDDLLTIWRNGEGLNRYRGIRISNKCSQECRHFRKSCYGGCISEQMHLTRGLTRQIGQDRLCPSQK